MGQRSALVIGFKGINAHHPHTPQRKATLLGWTFGPIMIRNAARAMRLATKLPEGNGITPSSEVAKAAHATFCIDAERGILDGLHMNSGISEHALGDVWNNNGAFLVDCTDDGVQFAFLIGPDDGGDLTAVATAQEYMDAYRRTVTRPVTFGPEIADALDLLTTLEQDGWAMSQARATELAGAPESAVCAAL